MVAGGFRAQPEAARDKIKRDPDAGRHTLLHRFLTEAGDHTDAFRLRYVAARDATRPRCILVHPSAESGGRADQSVKKAAARRSRSERSQGALEELR